MGYNRNFQKIEVVIFPKNSFGQKRKNTKKNSQPDLENQNHGLEIPENLISSKSVTIA